MNVFWEKIQNSLLHSLDDLMEFQERVWIVNIRESQMKNESFVVSEDSFREPMEWMVDQDYPDDVLEDLELLKPSQSICFKVGNAEHCIMRVK
nr:hypothetical protein [Enterovibrio paralichthyis]